MIDTIHKGPEQPVAQDEAAGQGEETEEVAIGVARTLMKRREWLKRMKKRSKA